MEFSVEDIFHDHGYFEYAALHMMIRTPSGAINYEPGAQLDFYCFAGDGIVTTSDWYSGGEVPDMSYIASGDYIDHVSIEITDLLNAAKLLDVQYLGIRVSTEHGYGFSIYDEEFVNWLDSYSYAPYVSVVPGHAPEPCTFMLLSLYGFVVFRRR